MDPKMLRVILDCLSLTSHKLPTSKLCCIYLQMYPNMATFQQHHCYHPRHSPLAWITAEASQLLPTTNYPLSICSQINC